MNFLPPKNIYELHSFLGLANQLKGFIEQLTSTTNSLKRAMLWGGSTTKPLSTRHYTSSHHQLWWASSTQSYQPLSFPWCSWSLAMPRTLDRASLKPSPTSITEKQRPCESMLATKEKSSNKKEKTLFPLIVNAKVSIMDKTVCLLALPITQRHSVTSGMPCPLAWNLVTSTCFCCFQNMQCSSVLQQPPILQKHYEN